MHVVNLDPAAEQFEYPVSFDVRELVSLGDVMEELGLGPNGGLLACMEYLEENLHEWLGEELEVRGGFVSLRLGAWSLGGRGGKWLREEGEGECLGAAARGKEWRTGMGFCIVRRSLRLLLSKMTTGPHAMAGGCVMSLCSILLRGHSCLVPPLQAALLRSR